MDSKIEPRKILQALILLLLSFFITVGVKVHFGGEVWWSLEMTYIEDFRFTDVFVFMMILGTLCGIFWLIKRFYKNIQNFLIGEKEYKMRPLYIWLIVMAVLVVCWLPYLLSFAPGSVLGDSLASIEQIYSGQFSNHHPVLYTLLVGVFVKMGELLGNINIGIFLYSCFQYLILAASLSYVVLFLARRKIRLALLVALVVFFAICPIFPSYAIIMWKDPIFSIFLLMLSLLLFKFAEKGFGDLGWQRWMLLVVFALGVAFFRNNGIFILMLLMPLVLLIFRKPALKTVLVMGGVVLFSLLIQGPGYSLLKISKPSVEAFAVPIQQVAFTVSENEGSLREEDKSFLNEIMPLETWKKAYAPTLVDTIKWHEDFNTEFFQEHLGQFAKLWLKLLPGNFDGYVNSYLLETLGFWHPVYQNEYGYIDQYIAENDFGIHEIDLVERMTGGSLKEELMSFRPMIGAGLMILVVLFSLVLSLRFQKKRVLMLYLASVACWAVIMISTPVAFSLRYVFVLMLISPILIFCPFFKDENMTPKEK